VSFADMKLIYAGSCVVLGFVILWPTLTAFFPLPSGERFSELWVLGPNHLAKDYPFNVTENEDYLVHVGVGNHLGSSSYYTLYVKFRNQTEPLPNATTGVPSPLAPLYEYRVFVADNASSEVPLTFSFANVSFAGGRAFVGNLVVNGVSFAVNEVVSRDADARGYYFQVFVELWIYDSVSNGFSYHNRFVNRWLNLSSSV
jgi:hypothetical protein